MKPFVGNMLIAVVILLVVAVGSIVTINWGLPANAGAPHWADTEVARVGLRSFNQAGCANCHSFIGQQGQVAGPRLDWVGDRYDEKLMGQLVRNPRQFFPNTIMPSYAHLSDEEITNITRYLATFKSK